MSGFAECAVEIVDGRAMIRRVDFSRFVPLDAVQLARIDWGRVASDVVVHAVLREQLPDERGMEAVLEAGEAQRSYRRLTFDDLGLVAKLWADGGGGPQLIVEHFHVSKRQANRYIARARQEGLL